MQSKDITLPYDCMLQPQKDFLLELISTEKKWIIHDNVMLYKRSGARKELSTVDVLESICGQLLTSKAYPDPKARLAICNIVLQRIQASIPLSAGVQRELNQRLFPDAKVCSDDKMSSEGERREEALRPEDEKEALGEAESEE